MLADHVIGPRVVATPKFLRSGLPAYRCAMYRIKRRSEARCSGCATLSLEEGLRAYFVGVGEATCIVVMDHWARVALVGAESCVPYASCARRCVWQWAYD